MERGLYIAASGMLAETARQDQLANDLANASTPGYKADRVSQRSFGDLMLSNSSDGSTVGPLGQGAAIDKQETDLRPQALRDTGQPLDLAVTGDGYFGVQTKQGVRYTRNGSFSADAQGKLVDQLGNQVLGKGNQPVKILFGTQIGISPPTYALSLNHPVDLHFSYRRYLENQFRENLDLEGTPVVIKVRTRKH